MKLASPENYRLFGVDFSSNAGEKELIRLIQISPERMPLLFCRGDAGTGKTFAALAGALNEIRSHGAKRARYKTLFYVREPVEVGHRLGYLKGNETDKYEPYLGPLLDNYQRLMSFASKSGEADSYKPTRPKKTDPDAGEIPSAYSKLPSDIVPLAPEFLRGRSFEDAIILADEAQNFTLDELQMLVTRIGKNCKLIVLGSPNQVDVPEERGAENPFLLAYQILKPTGMVGYVELTEPMRSSFVAEFDEAFAAYKKAKKEGK